MRGSAARRRRTFSGARFASTTTRPTVARTTVALLTTAAVLASGGCLGGSDDASHPGGSGNSKRPAAKPGLPWNTSPDSIASLGDSITRGFDACSVLADCPEVSWSTGTEVNSLARRLLPAASRSATRSWNYAKTGAVMADLSGQIQSAVTRKPQLVTILIGANDACRSSVDDMTPTADFRAEFSSALKTLRHDLPKTQVYVASVPDLKRLWSEGRKNVLGRQIWKLGICPSMLKDSDATDPAAEERRRRVEDRVDEYNATLKAVCAQDVLCRYDDAVHNYRFSADELSKWDWFHPSKEGQQQLAAMAYRRITAR
ncbi:SGNH/GDSL hydrolase family protein [Streptomyces sp. ME19-01-6]|uniref:SGNH/GDSL hydrolase family protein n=1 Tax=Streptomyces sp. ME19-01-6 TaxID=3028686 RepID=UPI0029A4246E|nr:SGNH/GDSL hydrolase family protein [Streptomyces sp. ME19-01-6]MDX3224710.1 GDSL-type esterase/lipase family protein [Streptomyces sp. ME19-01-6]